MCRESDRSPLTEDVEDALRWFYGGLPPEVDYRRALTRPAAQLSDDVERGEPVA